MQTNLGAPAQLPLVLPIEDISSDGYCECLIRGRAQRGALVRLLAIFESRGVKVLNSTYESSADSGIFGASLILQLEKNTDSETLSLVEKLMGTRIVSSVEFAPLRGRSFANFRFPVVILPGIRGVILQPELLGDAICKSSGSSGTSLFESGSRYGRSFALQARSSKKLELPEETCIQILKATGWGTGKYEKRENGEFLFSMADPAIGIETENEGKNKFLVGLIQGMFEEFLGGSLKLMNERYDGKTNSLVLKFSKVSSN